MSKQTALNEFAQYAYENIKEWAEYDESVAGDEIHQRLFNEDYYTIGRHEAEEDLKRWVGVFNCIETIKEYEQDNFGAVSTDLSDPEKVVNMYVYILGEEVLSSCDIDTNKNYDKEMLLEICETLKNKFSIEE